jgi:lysine-specific demethylase 3
VHENLRTQDGAHATAVDERNIRCVCGKLVRLCNVFYWKYLVQKPMLKNGVVVQKGHWFTCPTVLEKGSVIAPHKITEAEIEASKAAAAAVATASGTSSSSKRSVSSSRVNSDAESEPESSPVKRRSRRVIKRSEAAAETAALAPSSASSSLDEPAAKKRREAAEFSMEKHIRELLASRVPGETFLQDGPCFEMGFEVSMCRMCRLVDYAERREMLFKGVDEDSCDISCCFYGFRKLKATKGGQLSAKGYLNPKLDPNEKEMELWVTGKSVTGLHVKPNEARYILGLIGDQFCDMVQQEYKCLALNMCENKSVVWKPAVKGVREMCDVCKTTLFNFHWMCDRCGMFICLDCYQFRRTGLVKDYSDRRWGEEEPMDEYNWPMCNNGEGHLMERLLMAQIIPKNALLDMAKKLHEARSREGINQFCHSKEEIPTLFSEDGLIKFGVSIFNSFFCTFSRQMNISQRSHIQ